MVTRRQTQWQWEHEVPPQLADKGGPLEYVLALSAVALAVVTGWLAVQTKRVADSSFRTLEKAQEELDTSQRQLEVAIRSEKALNTPRLVPTIPEEPAREDRQVLFADRTAEVFHLPRGNSGVDESHDSPFVVISLTNIGTGPAFLGVELPQPSISGPFMEVAQLGLPSARAVGPGQACDIAIKVTQAKSWTPRGPSSAPHTDLTLEVRYSGIDGTTTWTTTVEYEVAAESRLAPLSVMFSERPR